MGRSAPGSSAESTEPGMTCSRQSDGSWKIIRYLALRARQARVSEIQLDADTMPSNTERAPQCYRRAERRAA
jgi:hypothetical protein